MLVGQGGHGHEDVEVTVNLLKSKFLSPLGALGLSHTCLAG